MGVPINEIASGGKAWSGEVVGDRIKGIVKLVERRQQRDFTTGDPLTWSDGSPRMLTYIELETSMRDSDDDDGTRALYAKGGNFEVASGTGAAMERAIVEAVKAVGASSIDEGAELEVVHSGLAKPTTRGYQPAKLYAAKYTAPTSSVDVSDLFSDD